ncbi:MAG: hypothetical protein HQ581_10115 [Planctomycetes bacterium]|nr:hypothetical protein [Planctomycetota bacterium]
MRTIGLIMLATFVALLASCGHGDQKPSAEATATARTEKETSEQGPGTRRQAGPQSVDQASPKKEPSPAVEPAVSIAPEAGDPSQPAAPESTPEPPTSNQTQLERSLQTWNDLKAKCGGNYSYKIRWSSWVGFGHETEVVVRDNKVAERRYREWSGRPVMVAPGKPPEPEGETWTEQGEQLGSHSKGAPLKTLDQLYGEAKTILDQKLEPHLRLYIRFDDRGLLKSCFYVDTRIADDAPQTGVVIGSIELEKVEE